MNNNFNFNDFKAKVAEIDNIVATFDGQKDALLTNYILKEFVKFDNPIDMVARLYAEKVRVEKEAQEKIQLALQHACFYLKNPTVKSIPSNLRYILGAFPNGVKGFSVAEQKWYTKVAIVWLNNKHDFRNFINHFPELKPVVEGLEKHLEG